MLTNPKERWFDNTQPGQKSPRRLIPDLTIHPAGFLNSNDRDPARSPTSPNWQQSRQQQQNIYQNQRGSHGHAILQHHQQQQRIDIPDDPIPVSPGGVGPRSGNGYTIDLPRVTGEGMPCAQYETEAADDAIDLRKTLSSEMPVPFTPSSPSLAVVENQASSQQEQIEQRRMYIPLNEVQQILSRPRHKHNVAEEVDIIFRQDVGGTMIDPDVAEWLKLATWWLLKSRVALHAMRQEQQPVCRSMHSKWISEISETQAYADLLKSSWIFEEIIVPKAGEKDQSLLSFKMMKDLIMSLNQDLTNFTRNPSYSRIMRADVLQRDADLRLHDTSDLQLLYPIRRPSAGRCQIEFDRCVNIDAVEAHPSGWADEQVLFRSFVDIQIGVNNEPRMKSQGAPYFLVLWTKKGESEIFLSLFDQQRVLDLSHELTRDDLMRGAEERCHCSTAVSLKFDNIHVEVNFLSRLVRDEFMSLPVRFFDEVYSKYPQDGERLLYRRIIRNFKPQFPKNKTPTSKVFELCELRLYETVEDQRWRTTRRLVVSSSASDYPSPWWCKSYWLPFSQIHVKSENSLIELSWSDYMCLDVRSDGNYGNLYSMVFKPDEPNNKITISFKDVQDIAEFRENLLFPVEDHQTVTIRAKLPLVPDSAAVMSEMRIYDINKGEQSCRQLVSFSKSPVLQYKSETSLVYRDLDFEVKPDSRQIEFFNMHIPWYTSDIEEKRYKPEQVPMLQKIIQIRKNLHLPFSSFEHMKIFLMFLTNWELKSFKIASRLVLSEQKRGPFKKLTSNTTKLKEATVYLWQKVDKGDLPNRMRTSTMAASLSASSDSNSSSAKAPKLAIRLNSGPRRWLTASLLNVDTQGMTGSVANLHDLDIRRGNMIDIQTMNASHDTPTGHQRSASELSAKSWRLEISFKSFDDNLDFLSSIKDMRGSVTN